MIPVNCDLGERGPDHPVDIELMQHVQIANIACGGHAGDAQSVALFRERAAANGVTVTAHLSYPDRENFGRTSLRLDADDLLASLDAQLSLMRGIKMVKFHGALYNDSAADPDLAAVLGQWAIENHIETIIAPSDSEMAASCHNLGIHLMAEAFAERRYTIDGTTGRLKLTSRQKAYACIHDCALAAAQAKSIAKDHQVEAVIEDENGQLHHKVCTIEAETICIHSDSPIALELAQTLAADQRTV
jgi:UPF0271 protein